PEAKEPEKIQKPKKSDRVRQVKESEKISEVKESEQVPKAKEPEKIQKPKKSDRVRQVKESEKISEVKESESIAEAKEPERFKEVKEPVQAKEAKESGRAKKESLKKKRKKAITEDIGKDGLEKSEPEDKIIIKSDELKKKNRRTKKALNDIGAKTAEETEASKTDKKEKKPVKRASEAKKRRLSKKEAEDKILVRKDQESENELSKRSVKQGKIKAEKNSGKKEKNFEKKEKKEKKSSSSKAGFWALLRKENNSGNVNTHIKPESEAKQKSKDNSEPKVIKTKKDRVSDFRLKSADWKDHKVIEKTKKTVSFKERKKQLAGRIKKVTPLQWSIAAMALVIFVSGIMTSAVYANYQGEQNKAIALASLNQYKEDESYVAAVETVTEEMIPEAVEEAEPVEVKSLFLEMSSVEKDLKIKLVDEEDTLVKDVTWSVTVSENEELEEEAGAGENPTDENSVDGAGKVYEDDDRDGVIYITDIAAGDYSVTVNPSDALADYILPQEKQLVSVKATIEYKVIANIKDEIKTEKEVNVALEDPNGNQAADVETSSPAVKDTVEWCESTQITNGEEYVEATPDISKTAVSVKKNTGLLVALKNVGLNARKNLQKGTLLGFKLPLGYLVATEESADGISQNEAEIPTETPTSTPEVTEIPTQTPTPTPTPTTVIDNEIIADPVIITPTPTPVPAEESSLSISGTGTVIVGSSITLSASYSPSSATVTWRMSDSDIAALTDNGATCMITGKKAGTVTVTAVCSNGKETSMTVTVSNGEYSDDAKLYDASKNLLYVKDGDNYREATYGDYKSGIFSTYYRKQEGFLYTGWQNIEGKTYYYTSDHNYVTGDQIIQGIKYSFGIDGVLATGSGVLGIDVSKYQPNINWASVKASGVSYVIIRCGYRGASTGVLIQDPYFTSHIKGAKAAGLKVGVYFFTTALTEAEAVEEASMCAALCSGYGINYPIFMDCETSSRPGYNSLSAAQRTQIIKAFCNTIRSAGYTPGVYANKTWFTSYINTSSLSGCKIWLAQYNSAGPTYSGRYDIWQYTSKGKVDGISGYVDMNQSYLGY
nr:Ig-like domain-containing protein [Lachnospiraceae bacterium]